jgi:hypothetical protein
MSNEKAAGSEGKVSNEAVEKLTDDEVTTEELDQLSGGTVFSVGGGPKKSDRSGDRYGTSDSGGTSE